MKTACILINTPSTRRVTLPSFACKKSGSSNQLCGHDKLADQSGIQP
jgi:hypothetical protein